MNTKTVEPPTTGDLVRVVNAESIIDQPGVLDAINRACSRVSYDWYGLVAAEDLASDVVERLLKIERKNRLARDLYPYGYPKTGEPDSLEAVVYGAARSWAGGICADEKARTELGYTNPEILDAVIVYGLVSDAPDWDSMPDRIRRIADELPNLSYGDLGQLERWERGDKTQKSNINRAAKNLGKLVAGSAARATAEHDGPGSRFATNRSSAIAATAFDVRGPDVESA
ncbi:hypothetical protein [Gordonia sp. QH-12]|uniref:hypothetical protein n=1 Tax=Gordonia sp. QH-12 TaxID=1437876 RepID=UPI0012E7F4CE|nr:hypothetical protein [Gordonia sp. QH-12]